MMEKLAAFDAHFGFGGSGDSVDQLNNCSVLLGQVQTSQVFLTPETAGSDNSILSHHHFELRESFQARKTQK